jgi:Na+-driven multidrug efflux pump
MEKDYKRSNRNMSRKLLQYMIPSMITYTALSLNEFADSMIVSNLLGSGAMAISTGCPQLWEM